MTYRFQGYGNGDPSLVPDQFENATSGGFGPATGRPTTYQPWRQWVESQGLPGQIVPGRPSGTITQPGGGYGPTDVALPPNGGGGQPTDVPPTTPPTTGGNGGGGAIDKAKSWWAARSTVEKGAIVVSGLAAVGLLAWAIFGGRKRRARMQPNFRRAAESSARTVAVGRRRYKRGRIKTVKGGRRFGHHVPPKRYRNQGARRPADYAWPAGYKYPLYFRTSTGKLKPALSRKRTRAAASYFGRNKHLYPPQVRRTIARNINQAKKRLGIGGKPATP